MLVNKYFSDRAAKCIMHNIDIYDIYDLVPKGVRENKTKGVDNIVDDTLKLVVFLECTQC